MNVSLREQVRIIKTTGDTTLYRENWGFRGRHSYYLGYKHRILIPLLYLSQRGEFTEHLQSMFSAEQRKLSAIIIL